MRAIYDLLPALPGMTGSKTYAPSPVWSGSVLLPVRFLPLSKKEATRLYHQAREFERQTRLPGRQDGALGRNGLAVLHAMIFDCLNYASGRLDPSYEKLAELAAISRSSVARGLAALRDCGVVTWLRRCAESVKDGRFTLTQETNAYALVPPTQWRGFKAKPAAPAPEPGTSGEHPCGARAPLTEAVAEIAQGGGVAAVVRQLEADPKDGLAAVLARLGRAIAGQPAGPSRSVRLSKNLSPESFP